MDAVLGALSINNGLNRPTNRRRWKITNNRTQTDRPTRFSNLTKL
jgi:hypothetical protein